MSSASRDGLVQLWQQFSSFCDSFSLHTKIFGDPVPESLASNVGVSYKPQQVFWKPRLEKADIFQDEVAEIFHHVQTCFGDIGINPRLPTPQTGTFDIDDAYNGSKRTLAAISHCVDRCMFSNDNFRIFVAGYPDFKYLEDMSVFLRIGLESRLVFCSPPSPNVTIISIQPQESPPNELVLTELFTLVYWAFRLARRGVTFTTLPIRVVSIHCTKARFLSADFSMSLIGCLMKEGVAADPTMIAPVKIGSYFEMSNEKEFLKFLQELIDIPIPPPKSNP